MLVTFDVFQLGTSNDDNDLQPSNMLYMLVTFDVSHFDTSNDSNFEQFWNISYMFVTLEVLISLRFSMETRPVS